MLDAAQPENKMQRAKGCVEVGFSARGLHHLYQSGCAKALLPRCFGGIPEAVFINSSGGVTGGDRLTYSAAVSEGATLCVTTQAAERIYRASAGVAEITNTLTLTDDSQLDWLPQETILFEGSALKRQLNVSMDAGSRLLALETIVLGRKAMGETLQNATLSDAWRIKRDRRLIYADALRFEAPSLQTGSVATLGGNRALATMIYVAPDAEDRLSQARDLLDFTDVEAAASAWNGMLVIRFLAVDAFPLRAALTAFLTQFRGAELPRVWHM